MTRNDEVEFAPGTLFADRWVVRGVLGRGATTHVYLGQDLVKGHEVAIKVLRSSCADEGIAHQRFLREVRLVSGLIHPSIVRLEGSGRNASGRPYLVMERLLGETLADRLTRDKRLELAQVQQLAADLLDALGAAHDAGIIHRDLKPENLFVTTRQGRERLVVLDFGVGRSIDDQAARITASPHLVGTLAYLSPEQVQAPATDPDLRADLYAAGVVAFQMLTGQLPYRASGIRVVRCIRDEPPLAVSSLLPQTSPEVDAFFARALAKPRSERFQNAQEMAAALCAC